LALDGRFSTCYSVGSLRKRQPDEFREELTALFYLLAQVKIKPSMARRMRLEQVVETHVLIEQAAVRGRIVLMINENGLV
jgi:NADPH:quinone reductase-like Zn-dependent oxidoreductase